jgi:hypothetical protein
MERHRDDQRIRRYRTHPARHQPRHRPRDSRPAAMFQLQRQRPCDRAISHARMQPVERWRIGQARAAPRIGMQRLLQRLGADRAGRPAEEIQRLPACEAETVIFPHDHPAAGAAWRQRIVNDPANAGA